MIGLFDSKSGTANHWKPTQIAEAALLLLATLCLGWYGFNWVASAVDQLWSNYSLDARLSGNSPNLGGFVGHIMHGSQNGSATADSEASKKSDAESQPQADAEGAQWPAQIARGEDIGRIEIPRLGISSIVRQGSDDHTLSRAVGHVSFTAFPGQKGNVGLAAHRDTYFRNLRSVRMGDVIRMVTPYGTYEYAVDSLKIVYPTNVEVLDPTPNPSLTLVTCYPFNYVGHAPKRFIVRAKQIQSGVTPPAKS